MIYLDHNATTPIGPEVLAEMLPYFKDDWGNPSSSYQFGSKLKTTLEIARERVARLIGAQPREVLFTGSASESNNTALGSGLHFDSSKRHIITCVTEHASVLAYCAFCEKIGYRVTYLPVDHTGRIRLNDLERAFSADTALVSIMWANNETGVLSPMKDIASLCQERHVLLHTDAVQAVGKIPVDVRNLAADYLSLAGHKINGPKGVGALYVRKKSPFTPHVFGGLQERGRRGTTENVPLIVGLGAAAKLTQHKLSKYEHVVRPLRDRLENGILAEIPDTRINGNRENRICNTTNISFEGVESEAILLLLDKAGICASSGSACIAETDETSHVITSMRPDKSENRDMIRFSLGLELTEENVDYVLGTLKRVVVELRSMRH